MGVCVKGGGNLNNSEKERKVMKRVYWLWIIVWVLGR